MTETQRNSYTSNEVNVKTGYVVFLSCDRCGSMVYDTLLHDRFHVEHQQQKRGPQR